MIKVNCCVNSIVCNMDNYSTLSKLWRVVCSPLLMCTFGLSLIAVRAGLTIACCCTAGSVCVNCMLVVVYDGW